MVQCNGTCPDPRHTPTQIYFVLSGPLPSHFISESAPCFITSSVLGHWGNFDAHFDNFWRTFYFGKQQKKGAKRSLGESGRGGGVSDHPSPWGRDQPDHPPPPGSPSPTFLAQRPPSPSTTIGQQKSSIWGRGARGPPARSLEVSEAGPGVVKKS